MTVTEETPAVDKGFDIGAVDGVGAVWQMPLTTNGRSIVYKLDTGAQANILPFAEYQRLDPRPKLHAVKSVCLLTEPKPLLK